jgi:hypothetical protein
MQEIISQIKDVLNGLPAWAKVLVIICFLAAGLAYTFLTQEGEIAPVTTTKTVDNLNVNATGGDTGAINISQ